MHNIKGDDEHLPRNIFFMIFCSIGYKLFAFPQSQYVLNMFLNFGHFSASCSYKKVQKKSVLVYFSP